jgi:hypothetical protein
LGREPFVGGFFDPVAQEFDAKVGFALDERQAAFFDHAARGEVVGMDEGNDFGKIKVAKGCKNN